jgi:serine/threonine protein kinase
MNMFNRMYSKAGSHPNIVKMYGIAKVPMKGRMERALLMEEIPGPNADDFFRTLRQAWQSGRISSEEYWSVVQQCGRDMLDAVEHLGKAGILHNDIRPHNCIIDSRTGRLVLIDFGLASKMGSKNTLGDLNYMSADRVRGRRSDVFSAGANLVRAVEGFYRYTVDPRSGAPRPILPRDGAVRGRVLRPDGRHLKPVNSNHASTAWTEFADRLLARDIHQRPHAGDAKQLRFLADSMLDGEASRQATQKVLRIAAEENAKAPEERWRVPARKASLSAEHRMINREELQRMRENPSLARLEWLQHNSKTDPKLAREMKNIRIVEAARPMLEQEAAARADALLGLPGIDKIRNLERYMGMDYQGRIDGKKR